MPDVAAALTAPGAGVDVATGLVLVAAGAVALARGRGPLLLVAGAAWLAGDVWDELVYAHRGPLVHLLLGRSPVTALAYIDGLVPSLARDPWLTLGLAAAVVLAAGRRVWSAREGGRRSRHAAALAGALAVAGAPACEAIGRLTGHDTSAAAAAAWWYDIAVVAVALGFALAARPRPAGAIAADLVIDLAAEPQALRAALSRAIGDPTLEVAYRVGADWVDEAGREVRLHARGDDRVVRVIDDLAALVHDAAVLHDDALGRSIDSALRLALVNVRLQADVASRLREVELSRRRLVEAGDAERRRLREQLRAGAEGDLDAAGDALAPLPGAAALRDELEAARANLSRFAQGIHPRALTERGLRAALEELVAQAPVAVELAVPADRFARSTETVAYFVCSEALANVAKYAPAARVQIAVSAAGQRLQLQITDDGPGGADPRRGSGLRGLADRVEALAGRLDVTSAPGCGTRVSAELPLGTRAPGPAALEPAAAGAAPVSAAATA